MKLAIHHQLSSGSYPWTDLHPLQLDLLAAFGARRLMWGGNFPMFLPTVPYGERLEAVSRHLPLSEEDRERILGRTADSLWPPGDPP